MHSRCCLHRRPSGQVKRRISERLEAGGSTREQNALPVALPSQRMGPTQTGTGSICSSSSPVRAKCPRWLVPNCSSNPSRVVCLGVNITPGVVDQQVDPRVLGPQLACGGADGIQRGQVEGLDRDVRARGGVGDAVGGALALVEAGRPRAGPGPRRPGLGWRRLPCGWRSSGRPRRASTGEASRSARCGGAGRTIRRPGASRRSVTVAETGHHRVRRRRRGTAGWPPGRSRRKTRARGTARAMMTAPTRKAWV
jgi:hypothetical protein